MTTAFIVLNLVLAAFVLAAILSLSVGGIRASNRAEISPEAQRRLAGRGRRSQPRAERRESGTRRSGRAVAA